MLEIKNIINSYNFARSSDFVFAETVSHKQFKKLNISDKYIVEKNNLLITYKLDYVYLRENDVIFCNSDFLKDLFILLKKIQNLQNLKLITHQTDLAITKSLFLKKPACIAEWYSINVAYEHENLIPIPLGIANEYSPKNLQIKDLNFNSLKNKDDKLYVNFNQNTNHKKRNGVYRTYQKEKWAIVKHSDLTIEQYKLDLKKYLFILSPWGNGVDTHRFWEALYSGSIPVTEFHHTYSTSYNLPVLFVENIKEIDNQMLLDYLNLYRNKNFNFDKLDISFWLKKINKHIYNSDQSIELNMGRVLNYYLNSKYKYSKLFKSKIKRLNYLALKPFRYFQKIVNNN